jgi:RNA recognition motif-containing protein
MSKKVFIGNVPFQAQDEELQKWFSEHAIYPAGVAIVKHRVTGKSRGFGFADFERPEDAEAAVNALNGMDLDGRRLMLSLAHSEGPAVQQPAV